MPRFALLLLGCSAVLACGGGRNGAIFDEPTDAAAESGDDGGASDATADVVAPDTAPPPDTSVEDTTEPPPPDALPDVVDPPDVPVLDSTLPCTEPGAKMFGTHCYFPINSRQFIAARDYCASRGAHLVTIGSPEEQSLVHSIYPGYERWIGLARPESSAPISASYKWITGEPKVYEHWAGGEPNGSGTCARMLGDGRWADIACNQWKLAVCERE